MTSRTFISDRAREVYQGRKLPWHFYAGLGAPFAVLVLVLYAAGVSPGGEIMVLAFGYCAIASFVYLGSRLRNYVALHPDRITISVWLIVPAGTHHIAYDRITRVEADDASDTLSLSFKDDAGDSGATGITLSQPSSVSKVRDAILLRQSSLGVDHGESEAADANAVSPAEIVPEMPGEKHRLRVETPGWIRLGFAVAVFGGVFAAYIGEGRRRHPGISEVPPSPLGPCPPRRAPFLGLAAFPQPRRPIRSSTPNPSKERPPRRRPLTTGCRRRQRPSRPSRSTATSCHSQPELSIAGIASCIREPAAEICHVRVFQ